MELLVLQINGYPSDWDTVLDGIPPGGGTEFVAGRLCEAGAPTSSGLQIADGLRRFVYWFVEGGPDINYDRETIAVDELREVLSEVESAMFRTMAGTPGGIERLREAGAGLTRSLLPERLIERLFGLPEGTPVVIRVDDVAASVPWELCYSSQYGTFLGTHLAVSRGVAVRSSHRGGTASRLDDSRLVSLPHVSCVVNPENDPAIAPCAQALDELAWELQSAGCGAVLSVQVGVSRRKLLGALEKPAFHFTGHVHFDRGRGSFILCSDRLCVDAREVTTALRRGIPPKLAILNGCRSDRAPQGEPEIERSATHASFVQQFYRNGALSVIGTRCEVDTGTAHALESHFFRAFAGEPRPIGELMRQFRKSDACGWPCYLLYGDPRIQFALRAARQVSIPKEIGNQGEFRTGFSDHQRSGQQGQPAGDAFPTSRPPGPEPGQASPPPQIQQAAVSAAPFPISGTMPLPPQTFAIRRPGIRTPLYATILIENSPYVQEYSGVLDAFEGFLDALTARVHRLNAELDPYGSSLACGLRVIGYPAPLQGIPDEFSQPAVDLPWRQCFAGSIRGTAKSCRLSRLLKAVLSDLKKLTGRSRHLPLPAPAVIVCCASDPQAGAIADRRDADDAIRICEDLRQLTLPELPSEPHFGETTAKTIALGFGHNVPESFLRGLAWGGTAGAGLWRRFHSSDEARRFADELFRCLLEPQSPEPLDGLGHEFDNARVV
jgi:hypothetical protein